jgi:thioesterase domain-containing protein
MKKTTFIQKYLHDHIPLSKAMEVAVVEAGIERIVLSAPLKPNINHRETVFGGSASALAILAGWSLVHFRLQAEQIDCRVVIQRNQMSYEKPIFESFTAVSEFQDGEKWKRFCATIKRKGRARIVIRCDLVCSDQRVGVFEGFYVAFDNSGIN